VEVADHVVGPGGVEMGIDLGGFDAGIAEQLLPHAQVGAAGMHVGDKGMEQHVREDPLGAGQPCGHGSFLNLQQSRLVCQHHAAVSQLGLKSSHSCATSVVRLR
jgi:hypothetical protein